MSKQATYTGIYFGYRPHLSSTPNNVQIASNKGKTNRQTQKSPQKKQLDYHKQYNLCEDALNALLHQSQHITGYYIKKISSTQMQAKLNKINCDFHYIQERKTKLQSKIGSLNDIFNKMTQKNFIHLNDVKINDDDIKQLKLDALMNAVKLTNECKIITALLVSKGQESYTLPAMNYANTESITRINQFKNLLVEYYQLKKSIKPLLYEEKPFLQNSNEIQLKKEIACWKKIANQLQQQKTDLRNLSIQKDNLKCSQQIKGLSITKEAKQKKIILPDTSPEQELKKLKLLESQSLQLKLINEKLTKDHSKLLGVLKISQQQIERLKIELNEKDLKLNNQIAKQRTNFNMTIERLDQKIKSLQQELQLLGIKYNKTIDDNTTLFNENKKLGNQLSQSEKTLAVERKQWKDTFQDTIINSTRLQDNEKSLNKKIKWLQQQLQLVKAKSIQLNQDKAVLQGTLKRIMEDKEIENDDIAKQRQQNTEKANKLQIQAQKLDKRMKSAQLELDSSSKKLKQQYNRREAAEHQGRRLSLANKKLLGEIEQLKAQNTSLKAKIKEFQHNKQKQDNLYHSKQQNWKADIEQKSKQLSRLCQSYKQQEKELKQKKQENLSLNRTLQRQRKSNQNLSQKLSQNNKQSNDIQLKVEILEKDNQIVTNKFKKTEQELTQLRSNIQQLKDEVKYQQSQKNTVQHKYEDLQASIQREKNEVIQREASSRQAFKKLEEQIFIKDNTLGNSSAAYQKALAENKELRQENEKLIKQVSDQRSQIARLSHESQSQKQYIASMAALQQKSTHLQRQIEIMKQAQELKDTQAIQFRNQLDGLNGQILALRGLESNKHLQLTRLQEQLQNQSNQLAQKQQQNRNALKNASQKLKKTQEQANHFKQQIEYLQGELERTNAGHKKLDQQLEKETNQNINLTEKLQRTQELLQDAKANKNVLEKELADIRLRTDIEKKFFEKQISFIELGLSSDPAANVQNIDTSCNKATKTQLQDQLDEKEKQFEAWRQQVADAQAKIHQFESQKQLLRKESQSIKQVHEKKEKALIQTIKELEEKDQKSHKMLTQKQNSCSDFEERLKTANEKLQATQKELFQKAKILQQILRVQQKHEEKQRLWQDSQLFRVSEAKLQGDEIVRLKGEKAQLELNLKEISANNEFKLQNAQNAKKTLEKDLLQKYNTIQRMEVQQKIKQTALQSIQAELNKQAELKKLQQQKWQQQKRDLEAQIAKLNQKVSQYEGIQREQSQNILRLERNLQESQERKQVIVPVEDFKAQKERLVQQVLSLTVENKNFENVILLVNTDLDKCRKNINDIIQEKDKELDRVKENHKIELSSLIKEKDELPKQKHDWTIKERKMKQRGGNQMDNNFPDSEVRIKKLEEENARLSSLGAFLQAEAERWEKEKQKLQTKNKKYQEEINDLTHQVEVLNETLEEMSRFNQSMQARGLDEEGRQEELEELADKLRNSKARVISEKEQEVSQLENQLKEATLVLASKQSQLSDLQAQVDRMKELQEEKNHMMAQLDSARLREQELLQTVSLKEGQLALLDQEKQLLRAEQEQYMKLSKQDLQKAEQRIKMLEQEFLARKEDKDGTLKSIFQHELLEIQPAHKLFLKEAIERECSARIFRTRLVYRYDPDNKVNFHHYIDGHENLVLIVKMANGTFLAAFTEDSFESKKHSQRSGLIISLTNCEVFTLREPNFKAIVYDDYYIIFGNSEIRLKSQENRLFSNFGIANSYYSSRGHKVSILLGGERSERELDIENYEIYQLEMVYDL